MSMLLKRFKKLPFDEQKDKELVTPLIEMWQWLNSSEDERYAAVGLWDIANDEVV